MAHVLILALLSLTDASGCPSFIPNILCIFWLSFREIDCNACLVQMFFIHMLIGMGSGVLMLMSLDCYVTICYPLCYSSLVAQMVQNLPAVWENGVQPLGQEDPVEKEMATHSRILAWKSHGQRSLAGYSPCGHKDLDTAEQLTHIMIFFHPHQHHNYQSWPCNLDLKCVAYDTIHFPDQVSSPLQRQPHSTHLL